MTEQEYKLIDDMPVFSPYPLCTHYTGFSVTHHPWREEHVFPTELRLELISSVKFKSRLDEMSLVAINPVTILFYH